MFNLLPTSLQLLISPLLLYLIKDSGQQHDRTPSLQVKGFTLRHEHATTNDSRIIFSDANSRQSALSSTSGPSYHSLRYEDRVVYQPKSFDAFNTARTSDLTEVDLWLESNIPAPRVDDRETLLTLAKMTSNAYFLPDEKGWYSLGSEWGNYVRLKKQYSCRLAELSIQSEPFGWEPDADGFRGYIFVSEDNSTVVLSVKGTSAGWAVGGGGPTVKKDKMNDNLLFSCCCARVGPTWSTVCDCYRGGSKCDQSCLQRALTDESLFYNIATVSPYYCYKNVKTLISILESLPERHVHVS